MALLPVINSINFVFVCLMLVMPCDSLYAEESIPTLRILNWEDYLDPKLVYRFEVLHRVKVEQKFYESDDHRDEILTESQGQGYDLVVVSGVMVDAYRNKGWLEPKPVLSVDGFTHSQWTDAFTSAKEYVVPYFWGTLGIAYRSDLVSSPITTWQQFFNPSQEFAGKISLINSSRDVVGMALKSLGYSANTEDKSELKKVSELLSNFSSKVKTLNYLSLDERSPILDGEVVAAMMFSGDTLMLQEYNENIKYVLPKEGGNIWVDYISVLKGAKDKALAWEFIHFINQPKNAAQLAQYIHFATPNTEAQKLLPKSFLQNAVIYPSKKALQKSEYYQVLPTPTARHFKAVFDQFKLAFKASH